MDDGVPACLRLQAPVVLLLLPNILDQRAANDSHRGLMRPAAQRPSGHPGIMTTARLWFDWPCDSLVMELIRQGGRTAPCRGVGHMTLFLLSTLALGGR